MANMLKDKVVLVTYVFGPKLPPFGRCVTAAREMRQAPLKLVAMAEECLARPLGPGDVDLLTAHARAAVDLGPPGFRGVESETHPDERERFVHDVVRRDQKQAAAKRCVAGLARAVVGRIGRVGASHPTCGIDEETVHRL